MIYAYVFSEENLVSEDTLPEDDEEGGGGTRLRKSGRHLTTFYLKTAQNTQ